MNKKSKIILISLLLLTFIISITNFVFHKHNNRTIEAIQIENQKELLDRISSFERITEELKEENNILNRKISDLQHQLDINNSLIQDQVKIINYRNNKDFEGENLILPIYTANINTYKKEIKYFIEIPKALPLEEQLSIVANKLSIYCFSGLPITVMEIKSIDGSEIAVVNLKETEVNKGIDNLDELIGKTWKANYFQGSAGGIITSNQLVDTFLQNDYEGKWIDGVQFLYEGNIIEFDHVFGLSDINYR